MPDSFFLYPLQAAIREFLWSEPFMHSFAIITEDKQEIVNQLQEALAGTLAAPNGKFGCSILIHSSIGKGSSPNIPATWCDSVEVLFLIMEQPMLNRDAASNPNATGYAALQVAEYLTALMKAYVSTEIPTVFREADAPHQPPYIDKDTGLIVHSVLMLCHGGLEVETEVVVAPVISLDASRTATITCAMADAQIFHTTDGTAPRYFGQDNPNNNGALYTGAFDASAFATIRARAYFPGWRASTITTAEVQGALQSENPEDILSEAGSTLKSE